MMKKGIIFLFLLVLTFSLTSCFKPNNGDVNNQLPNNGGQQQEQVDDRLEISFDYGNGTVEKVKVAMGSTIPEPVEPTKEGYTFEGWYNGEIKWEFSFYVVTSSMTLTAKFKEAAPSGPGNPETPGKPGKTEKITCAFDTGTTEKIKDMELKENSSIILPGPSQQKGDLVFMGWKIKELGEQVYYVGDEFYFDSSIVEQHKRITFVAVWEEKTTEPLKVFVGAESVAYYQEVLNKYVEDNNLPFEIQVTGVDTGRYVDDFLINIAKGADIFLTTHDNLGKLTNANAISPVTSDSLISNIERTVDSVLSDTCYLSVNGGAAQYYGVPVSAQTLVLYYDKTIFTGENAGKLGSWENILEVAKEKGKLAVAYTGTDNYSYSHWLLARPNNADTIAKYGEKGTLQLYSEGKAENCYAWGIDQQLIHNYAQQFTLNANGRNGDVAGTQSWERELQSGNVITVIGGPWHKNTIAAAWGSDGYGVTVLPTFTTADGSKFRSGSFYDTKCLVKKKASQYSSYLDQIMEYLSSDEIQQGAYDECGILPATVNVSVTDELSIAQILQGRMAGTPQPFGHNIEFNPNYYLKGTSYAFVNLHQNTLPVPDLTTEKVLKLISYTWATGNNFDYRLSNDVLNEWTSTKENNLIDISGVVFNSESFTYDGYYHLIECTNVPSGVRVEYVGNGVRELGEHNVTAMLFDSNNHILGYLEATITILPQLFDINNIVFTSQSYYYDGIEFNLTCSNVPVGTRVEYEGNGQVEVGEYVVTAKFYDLNDNYLGELTATLTIKALPDLSGVIFESKTIEYDGNYHSLECTNIPEGLRVSYSGNSEKTIGKYTVKATFYDENNINVGVLYADLEIVSPNGLRVVSLNPGVWDLDNAWYAVYWFNDYTGRNGWVRVEGYTAYIPDEAQNIIFCRMNCNTSKMGWDYVWNQTEDLDIRNCGTYIISNWGNGTKICPGYWR